MTNKKALFTWIITISLLVFIVLISACKTTTEPDPEPEPREPIELTGTKEFTVTVIHRGTKAELTGYDIEIDGPVSASESNVSSAQFTLEDVVSGEYTITVSLDGFVASRIIETFEVPDKASSDFLSKRVISLRESTPPVKVNNSESSSVTTGKSDFDDADDDEAITLDIPANVFPSEVVNEDGTVDISLTRARPSQITRTETGILLEAIYFEPSVPLNEPIPITIPLRLWEGYENYEFVLQPGDFPLTNDGDGNLVATITAGQTPGQRGPIVTFPGQLDGRPAQEGPDKFYCSVSDCYTVEMKAETGTLEPTKGWSGWKDLSNNQCGVGINADYIVGESTVPYEMSLFDADLEGTAGFTENWIEDPEEDLIIKFEVRHWTETYSFEDETFVKNFEKFQSEKSTIRCEDHDSGGSDG